MNIVCVLRASKDFQPEHVRWLKSQCDTYIPHDRFICYTDTPVPGVETIKLQTSWPRWWAKFEHYGDEIPGPSLVLDLDTVLVNPFEMNTDQMKENWVCRHPTRNGFRAPEEFSCGAMFLTEKFRSEVFEHFAKNPQGYMDEAICDDQRYFKKYFDHHLLRFQDEFWDKFVSYKLHVVQHGLREDNAVVMFHGLPRPWDVDLFWIPKLGEKDGHLHGSSVGAEC